jgi:hypothetical protein
MTIRLADASAGWKNITWLDQQLARLRKMEEAASRMGPEDVVELPDGRRTTGAGDADFEE